jgi:hypothetical protein
MWVETVVAEVRRLVSWPVVSLKHDDIAAGFTQRVVRDACNYTMSWESESGVITGVTVSAPHVNNTCGASIPVTFPGTVRGEDVKGYVSEQIGSDPLTVWVQLGGLG